MISKIVAYIKSKKISDYEIFYDSSDSINLVLQRNKIDFANEGRVDGLGIRVAIGKRVGFNSTLDVNNYEKCVDEAIKIAKLNNEDKKFRKFSDCKGKLNRNLGYDRKLLNFNIEGINKFIKDYSRILSDVDEKISITSGGYIKSTTNTLIVNSEGVDSEKKSCSNIFWAELMKDQGNTLGFSDQSLLPLNPGKAREHSERYLSMGSKSAPETQSLNIVFHPEALAELLDEAFAFSISAENVQNDKSIFAGKIDKKIMDKKLTVIDNSTVKGMLCSRSFDDEGVPSKKTVLVNNGILKNYLYDSYHANLDGKASTSSAVRSYNTLPAIMPSNLIIGKGTKSEDKILSSVDKCIFVKQLMATHVMDTTTGDFSLGVMEGHIYEKGKVKYAVKDTMVAGNLYRLLNEVLAIENKLRHAGKGYYLPALLCGKVKVIGK